MRTDGGAPHVKALDGLRGLAVLGVIAFHAGRLTGGYLGVDLFFVLSGYLITTLLVRENLRTGSIDLGHFWNRRARRLLPALLLVVLVCSVLILGAGPAEREAFRANALATLFYVANWVTIGSGSSYFGRFAEPSLLQHTWSLAIEEQFYLLWPVVSIVVLGRVPSNNTGGRIRGARRLLAVSLVGAAISAALMIIGQAIGTDTNRLYLGTDTRIAAILLGAALACALATFGPVASDVGQTLLDFGGWIGLLILAAAWWKLEGQSPAIYQGGLLICSIAGVLVIAAVTQREAGRPARVLSWSPLRGAGLISYGLYLWHWPILAWVTSARVGLGGMALLALQLALTLGVSLLSYFGLEMPIRRGALRGTTAKVVVPVAIGVVVLLAVVAGTPAAPAIDAGTAAQGIRPLGPLATLPPNSGTTPGSPDTNAVSPRSAPRVLLMGDSVGASIAEALLPYQSRFGIEARSEARTGCGFLRSNPQVRLADGAIVNENECLPLLNQIADVVATWRPDIVLVVLGWPGQTERLVEGEYRQPCDPKYDHWYRGELRAALDIAGRNGARVYLTTAPYYRSSVAPTGTDEKTDCLNRLYRDEAARAGVTIIDLAGYVCPAGVCRTDQDGILLRPDGLHFNGASSVWATDWLLQKIWSKANSPDP